MVGWLLWVGPSGQGLIVQILTVLTSEKNSDSLADPVVCCVVMSRALTQPTNQQLTFLAVASD